MICSLLCRSIAALSILFLIIIIQFATLVLAPLGSTIASLQGEIYFAQEIVLQVVEELDFLAQRLDYYSYSVNQGGERLYWYDPQPHPDIPSLQNTHPHHKHVPPDIKHNRIPAPGISFTQPNLPFLIQEIEQMLLHGAL